MAGQYQLSQATMGFLRGYCNAKFPGGVVPYEDYHSPTFPEMAAQHATGTAHVFAGGECLRTIFAGNRQIQWRYRAWHDAMHIKHGLSFSHDDELALATVLERELIEAGCPVLDAIMVRLDLVLHIRYHEQHGEHPLNQSGLLHGFNEGLFPMTNIPPLYHGE